jgi:hypothetical protein
MMLDDEIRHQRVTLTCRQGGTCRHAGAPQVQAACLILVGMSVCDEVRSGKGHDGRGSSGHCCGQDVNARAFSRALREEK